MEASVPGSRRLLLFHPRVLSLRLHFKRTSFELPLTGTLVQDSSLFFRPILSSFSTWHYISGGSRTDSVPFETLTLSEHLEKVKLRSPERETFGSVGSIYSGIWSSGPFQYDGPVQSSQDLSLSRRSPVSGYEGRRPSSHEAGPAISGPTTCVVRGVDVR